MSGHSKWQQIRRKKAVTDSRRGKIFTQIIKEITIASRIGGGDPAGNPRLRLAIDKAKANNMPAENIKRAIQRGTGELPGVTYDDVTFEAYGPAGVAIIIEGVTDNRNRTVSEMRYILDRNHGKMAASGAVAYQFHRKGIINIPKTIGEDNLLAIILDAGAEDLRTDGELYTVITTPETYETIKKELEDKKLHIEHAEIQLLPENTIKLEAKDAITALKLIESLEEHEDVQHVYTNIEMDASVIEQFNAQNQ
jgi:YebC/PmpR family DNA-binding regulatory protein